LSTITPILKDPRELEKFNKFFFKCNALHVHQLHILVTAILENDVVVLLFAKINRLALRGAVLLKMMFHRQFILKSLVLGKVESE